MEAHKTAIWTQCVMEVNLCFRLSFSQFSLKNILSHVNFPKFCYNFYQNRKWKCRKETTILIANSKPHDLL